ncbi:Geranylgeranyl transferase type-2 subunit alpha 1-like protein, partial [Drosera capensis]
MEEILELFRDLMALDTPHLQYYKDQHSEPDVSVPAGERVICMRFNNLSLTQFTSIERLLWVQMLYLSRNELRSINGIEAMQSLACLNLSNNKLCSFTALDPLRGLKSLEVLNISPNANGGHSIDTTSCIALAYALYARLQFENSGEVGVFSKLTNAYCLVAISGSGSLYRSGNKNGVWYLGTPQTR